jgi:hypothetical protein
MIKDSGNRREYETGAVRDIQEGKGRCDLMPLDVVAEYLTVGGDENPVLMSIYQFQKTGDTERLFDILDIFNDRNWENDETMLLEVSKHFEEGAVKYGEDNWKKGIPESSYIDSAVRHYLKWRRGDDDEWHDRAFVWNIMCLIWTHEHITDKPAEDKRCVETDCFYNNDCICTSPLTSAVNPTAGKECVNYCED